MRPISRVRVAELILQVTAFVLVTIGLQAIGLAIMETFCSAGDNSFVEYFTRHWIWCCVVEAIGMGIGWALVTVMR